MPAWKSDCAGRDNEVTKNRALRNPKPGVFAVRLKATRDATGLRLDVWLAGRLPELSRSWIQSLIKSGHVTVGGKQMRPHAKVIKAMEVDVDIPDPQAPPQLTAENIPLDILYEDAEIIVVNKPAGLVVHPAAGHSAGTLVNALLYRCRDLAGIGGEIRPGLVHRLDKDTTGALVVAKNERSMKKLANQFKKRRVHKEYVAVVAGTPRPSAGRIETLIGRSIHDRKKMSTKPATGGRIAITRYEVAESFGRTSLVRLTIETGRTHQIRVHMAHIGHPVLGDKQYGNSMRGLNLPIVLNRQMLHAEVLSLQHPTQNRKIEFRAPLPEDMLVLLAELRKTSSPIPQS
jgi:23S rRNA pseudouridine1911/1915/1917 synthase